MENFYMIETDDRNIIILMCTCESPFDYLQEITKELNKISFTGTVIIDELLHSGNSEERFINGYFENGDFSKESFHFLSVPRQSNLRKYMCMYLREDHEYLYSSGLTLSQIRLIERNCVI